MGDLCFCAWLIRDEKYAIGPLTLASSLQLSHPGIPRLLLITEDLLPAVLPSAKHYFNHIVVVPYVECHVDHNWKRFKSFYDNWLDYCFTRFCVLKAAKQCGYERVIVMDGDMICLHSINELFNMKMPAAQNSLLDGFTIKQSRIHKLQQYDFQKHELDFKVVPPEMVRDSVKFSWGMRGALYVLPCSEELFEEIIEYTLRDLMKLSMGIGTTRHCGPDEKVISLFFVDRRDSWYSIPGRLCSKSWVGDEIEGDSEYPRMLHFVSQKPWWRTTHIDKTSVLEWWTDFTLWYKESLNVLRVSPESESLFDWEMLETAKEKLMDNVEVTPLDQDGPSKLSAECDQLITNRRSWTTDSSENLFIMHDMEPCITRILLHFDTDSSNKKVGHVTRYNKDVVVSEKEVLLPNSCYRGRNSESNAGKGERNTESTNHGFKREYATDETKKFGDQLTFTRGSKL